MSQQNVKRVFSNNYTKPSNRSNGRSMGLNGVRTNNTKSSPNLYQPTGPQSPIERLFRFIRPKTYALVKDYSYASAFNSWISVYPMEAFYENIKTYTDTDPTHYKYSVHGRYTTPTGILELHGNSFQPTISAARDDAYKVLIMNFINQFPRTQMDTEQGDVNQDSDKHSNTIVTRDAAQTVSEESAVMAHQLPQICSTEPLHSFDSVMNRWMAMDGLEIKATKKTDDVIATYNLPSFLYKANKSPNLMPLENFIYGTYNVEFKFVVNANKFHVGKVLCHLKYDSYQMEDRRNSVVSALCRPHVILDLAVNNEGILAVPFKYHRTFVRNAKLESSQHGLKHAQYATVYVQILSPLGAVAGAPQSMFIRPFYRIKQAQLTGMSYRVALAQMDGLNLEGLLKVVGSIANLDRPTDLQRQTQVIPKSRLHFCAGKAPIDSVPMRIDPSTLTTFLPDHKFPEDPKDMMEIARIWGLAFAFEWKTSDAEGAQLVSQNIDPTYHCPLSYTGTPTPLEYVSSMYQFWSGPIEVRLDFVSNAFHSGSVMLSAEFGRTSSDLQESSATYTKTFHLGDQKSCTFTIPYIYDTPYRRTSCVPWCPLGTISTPEADVTNIGANALLPSVSARFKVRVINKLVPIQSVPQNIQVLVFWRAGENYTCHSPIMANLTNDEVSGVLDNFPGTYAVTQMDTGDKEDLDPTLDFSQGVPRSNVMSVDKHTNIKDLLRRPVQIVSRFSASKYYNNDMTVSATYIPCMPPSRMCGYKLKTATDTPVTNGIYSKGLIRSYHSHILNLFRFWRGSQRFTFLVSGKNPVYVAYIPHSGARIAGSQNYPALNLMVSDKKFSSTNPSTMGLPTEIILPGINPSIIVEAPFEMETNFALMQEQYNEDNFSWRDKGETNAGHFMLWSDSDFTLDAWWSAGDDFEVSNFYGIPPCKSFIQPFYKGDNYPTAQMDDEDYQDPEDFQDEELPEETSQLTKCWNAMKQYSFPAAMATLPAIPIIGTPLAVATATRRAENTLTNVEGHITAFSRNSADLMGTARESIQDVAGAAIATMTTATSQMNVVAAQTVDTANSVRDLVDNTQKMFSDLAKALSFKGLADSTSDIIGIITSKVGALVEVGSNLYNVVINVIIDIFMNLVDFNYRTLALSIARFITNIAGLSLTAISAFIAPLTQYFKLCFTASTQGDTATEHLSAGFWSEDVLRQGLGLFVGLIGTTLGASVDKKTTESWSACVLKRLCSSGGMSFLNGSMRFVETIFLMIKEAIFKILGWMSLENKALITMREKSKVIDNFVRESQLMLNEANLSGISNPEYKIRFWTNVVNAYEIQRTLAALPTNKVAPILSRMCGDVIKVGKEKMADLKSSPVRYEPFVICISGPSKIGKSFLTVPLATELLHSIGYKSSSNNPIYYRIQGSKFWNDYTDQPCVVIDEWMNLSSATAVEEGVKEMFQLKSPAVFIPEQAAIEEKKIRANPKLVIILTNTPFPDHLLQSSVTHPEAVYRRRDILLHADLTAEARNTDLHSMPIEDKQSFKHLCFKRYSDVRRCNSLEEDNYTYDATLEYLKQEFKHYDAKESENVRLRMAELQKFWRNKTLNLTDPFSLFYEGVTHLNTLQDPNLPSEMLEIEISRLVNAVNAIEEESAIGQVETEGILATVVGCVGVWTVKQLVDYIANYKPAIPSSVAECCVCNDRENIYACCGESFKCFERTGNADTLHVICKLCCLANSEVIANGCPMCRDASYVPIIPRDQVVLIKSLWRLRKMGMAIKPYIDLLPINIISLVTTTLELFAWFYGPLAGLQYGYVMSDMSDSEALFKCGYLITEIYANKKITSLYRQKELPDKIRKLIEEHIQVNNRLGRAVSDVELRLYREKFICPEEWFSTRLEHLPLLQQLDPKLPTHTGAVGRQAIETYGLRAYGLGEEIGHRLDGGEVRTEMDTIPHRRIIFTRTAPTDTRAFNYDFNDALFEAEWANPPESSILVGNAVAATCLHDGLLDDMGVAQWENGAFMVPTSLVHRRVEWAYCKEFCCLRDANKKDLCKEYFEARSSVEYVYINNNYHTEEFKTNWRSRLPSFMFPQWLDVASFTIKEPEDAWLAKLNIPPVAMTILKGIGVALTVFVAFKGLKSLSGMLFGTSAASQIISSGDSVIRKFKPEVRTVKHTVVSSQSGCSDAIMGKIVKNYFVLRIKGKDGTVKQCVGLGLKQRIGLLPRHYYEYLSNLDHKECEITLGPAIALDHGVGYTFCENDFLVSQVSDVAVFYLPVSYNMFKDITSYFGTDADINAKHSPLAQMIRVPTKHEKYVSVVELQLKGYKKTQTIVGPNGTFTSLDNLEYNFSQPGACGSAIMFHNHTRPIRGIHIAGIGKMYGGVGYAAVITQEDLENIPPSNNTVHVQGLEEPEFISEEVKMYLPEESVVNYKGSVAKSLIPFNSDKSSIRPSKIHEDLPWQTTKAPAILSKKDPRYTHTLSPLIAGCAKHGYLTKDFASDQLEEIAAIRKEELLSAKPLILSPTKLTIEESVVGFPGIPHYEGIKMNTSAGWPYCTGPKTTKDQWTKLTLNDQLQPIDCTVDDKVVAEVKRKEAMRKQGIVPVTLFVDTLKDEKKSIAKVTKLGGTRVFCSSPYDFTISMRQNFLHFVASYYANRDKLKHSVGISMVGHEVTQLVTDLLSVGNNIITLDYSNFGPGFNASVAGTMKHTILAWIREYVGEVNDAELEALLEENINSHHIMAGTVYQQRGGSPSGSPLTVVINSEENISYIMLAWLNLVTLPQDVSRWDEFNKHVVLRVYGDDLIMSVSDKYIDQFNGETIMDFFRQYKIVATDASKSTSIVRYTDIYEASYLKHKFHPHPTRKGEWIAALDEESVKDTPLWIQEPIQIDEATRINAEAAIRNAYGHGPNYFNEFRDVINRALRSYNIKPILITWKELDDNFFKSDVY